MAAFIVLDYQNLAGQFTINADKIIKYERQSHYTTVYLDGGLLRLSRHPIRSRR